MKAALVISERDNVATALERLEAGRTIAVGSRMLTVAELIPSGHKVALCDIAPGQPVVKYGSPIGVAIGLIREGSHVHTHNVASSRGRGDLQTGSGAAAPEASARLAEPADASDAPTPASDGEQQHD